MLNAFYVWATERMEEKDLLRFEAELNKPPAGVRTMSTEQEGANFMAFLGQVTG